MASPKATVVILGGTGTLGYQMTTVLLSEYRVTFPTVRITTRDPSSDKAKELAAKGAEVHPFSEPLDTLLAGADVVINVLPTETSLGINKDLVRGMLKAGVKVFFPDQWGVDNRKVDFPGFNFPGWEQRDTMAKEHAELIHDKSKLKVVRVMPGAFLSWVFYGIDIPKNSFQWMGSLDNKFGATDLSDIGRAVGQLAILSLDPATASSVPEYINIAGQHISANDIQQTITRVKGIPTGEITVIDPAPVKQMLRENYPASGTNMMAYIGVNIADGNADVSADNQNELVNPGQKVWKWKTLDDVLASM